MGPLRAVPPYSWVPWTNHPLAPGLGVPPKKVYPWGVPPRVSSRGQTPPRDVSPPISSSHQVSKSRCALRVSSFQFDQSHCFKMVSSLQSIVLFSVPIAVLFDMLKLLCHLPMGHECLRAMFRRCTHEELRAWARTLPWDHPVARKLDHEVHRRRMAGKCHRFHFLGCGSLFLIPFLIFYSGIQGVRVSTNSAVACPPMSLPSTRQTQLGRAVLGSKLFVLIFFVC